MFVMAYTGSRSGTILQPSYDDSGNDQLLYGAVSAQLQRIDGVIAFAYSYQNGSLSGETWGRKLDIGRSYMHTASEEAKRRRWTVIQKPLDGIISCVDFSIEVARSVAQRKAVIGHSQDSMFDAPSILTLSILTLNWDSSVPRCNNSSST